MKENGNEALWLDVEKILADKSPALAQRVPGFIVRYLKRILHQDELNQLIAMHGHLRDREFVAASLKCLGTSYRVAGKENLPEKGRFIFASNHPLGGLDGMVFIDELLKHYDSVRFPVNDILMNVESLKGIFLPVNKHGGQPRETARLLDEAYASDTQILYFPAGYCSRKRRGVISDLKWHKSFIKKAIHYKRDIIPAYFSGKNSNFFYNLSALRRTLGIKANLEMLYLVDEMYLQSSKKITLVFGEPSPWSFFDKSKSADDWAGYVRNKSYALAERAEI